MSLWDFIQTQVLKMQWLNDLTENILQRAGVNIQEKAGASLHFFLYDTVKIMLLLGFLIFIISYIQSYFPPERSRKILGRFTGMRANLMAALLGTVTPFCSCSSIPLFIGFSSAGLPIGVTFSFLISSPMVDLGSLVLLMTVFGAKIAILYVIIGLVLAIAGGAIIERLKMEDQIESYIKAAGRIDIEAPELTKKDRLVYSWDQTYSTGKKVFPYVLVGVGMGAFIHNWMPEAVIEKVLGSSNPFSVVLSTAVGVPMYADIFGTLPIAEALFGKGAQLGAVLAFMMAVTTLSLPSIIMLRKAVKPKLLTIFVGICTLGIIIIGYLFNVLQPFMV